MQMAYVDFARDCFRPQAEIQAILSNGDVHDAAAYRASMVPMGSGGIAFSILPGGFRFLSPRRKEHVTAPYSMEMRTTPCSMGQSPAGSLSHLWWHALRRS